MIGLCSFLIAIIISIFLLLQMSSIKKKRKLRQQDYFEKLLANLPLLNSPEELIHILAMGIVIFSDRKLITRNLFYVKKYLEDIPLYRNSKEPTCYAAVCLSFSLEKIRDVLGETISSEDIMNIIRKSPIFAPREIK